VAGSSLAHEALKLDRRVLDRAERFAAELVLRDTGITIALDATGSETIRQTRTVVPICDQDAREVGRCGMLRARHASMPATSSRGGRFGKRTARNVLPVGVQFEAGMGLPSSARTPSGSSISCHTPSGCSTMMVGPPISFTLPPGCC
jgi:hypothetical protein